MVDSCPFSDKLLKADHSLQTIVKIFSSLQKEIPLCLLPKNLPEQKVQEIGAKLSSSSLENTALLFLTSGTTGEAKIVKLTKENLIYSAIHGHPDWQIGEGDRYLLNLPLHHIAGVMILLRAHLSGASITFNLSEATHLSLVTTQLIRLSESAIKNVKGILLGGGPIPFALCQKNLPIFVSYGMTEMASQITTHRCSPNDTKLTLGHPLPGRELMIDETGEILVKGKTLFSGYLGEEKNWNDWFPTKDLGIYSEEGLQITGRKDRMFISGGENIHPEEIEKALIKHPQIYAATVKGIADPEWGIKAIANYAADHPIAQEELKEFLSTLLPHYKIPKDFICSPISAGKGIASLV